MLLGPAVRQTTRPRRARRPRWGRVTLALVMIALGLALGPARSLIAGEQAPPGDEAIAEGTGATAPSPTATPAKPPIIYVLRLDREVDHVMEIYVRRGLADAERAGAGLVIVELDTFGGLVTSAINVSELLNASTIPTVAWIHGKGISAGAMITYACDDIVVSRGSSFGGAVVVGLTPEQENSPVGEKYTRITAQQMRANAEAHGHYGEFAVAMTDVTVEIKYDDYADLMSSKGIILGVPKQYADDDEKGPGPRFVTPGTDASGQPPWQAYTKEYIVKKGEVLHFTDREALFLHVAIGRASVIDKPAGDPAEAITDIGKFAKFHGARIVTIRSTWSETVSAFLSSPLVSILLLLGGIIGIATELKVPGFGFPGILGITCIALLFFGQLGAGAARWTDLILVVIGIILLGIELFLIPGFGIVGILGIIAIVAGLFMMIVPNPPKDLPALPGDIKNAFLMLGLAIIASAAAIFLLYTFVLPHTQLFGSLVLTSTQQHAAGYHASQGTALAEPDKLIGRVGIAKSKLRPAGRAVFDGEPYDVVTRGDFIDPGAEVQIVEVKSNRIVVKQLRPPAEKKPDEEA
jgi:membrane-bound serine protease (ClpP class)